MNSILSRRTHILGLSSAGLTAVAIALSGCTLPAGDTTIDTADSVPAEATLNVPTPEAEPEPAKIRAKDINLRVKILSKQCFGSAGCNVEYRVEPAYNGDTSELMGRTIEITYAVKGLEDEQTNTFTLTDGDYESYLMESFGSTTSSGAAVTAKIIDISEW